MPIYAFSGEQGNRWQAYREQYLWEAGTVYERSKIEWVDARTHKYGNSDLSHYVDAFLITATPNDNSQGSYEPPPTTGGSGSGTGGGGILVIVEGEGD